MDPGISYDEVRPVKSDEKYLGGKGGLGRIRTTATQLGDCTSSLSATKRELFEYFPRRQIYKNPIL